MSKIIEVTASELAASESVATATETGTAQTTAGDSPPNPVLPSGNEIFWSAVFFLLFWLLMKYLLLPPIRAIQKKREYQIEHSQNTADSSVEEKAKLIQEHEMAMNSVRQEASQIIDGARQSAEAYRAEVISKVEAEINKKQTKSSAELVTARQKALTILKEDVTTLTSQAVGLVLGSAPDKKVVNTHIKNIQKNGGAEK